MKASPKESPCADSAVAAFPLFQAGDGGAIPTSALQFTIEAIPMKRALELNSKWHSVLKRNNPQTLGHFLGSKTCVAYAAEFAGAYFAVAIWTHPHIRAHDDGFTLELARMAVGPAAPKNTASRMLAVMRRLVKKKWPHLTRLTSYQAIDHHKGTIYRAAGWQPVGEIADARPQRFSNVNRNTRATAPLQTTSRKQRWEICL